MASLERYSGNPVLKPEPSHDWEAKAVFNGSVVMDDDGFHLVYRAQSKDCDHRGEHYSVSSIGYAHSFDGVHWEGRRQILKPEEAWEAYGCEDPRITKLGDTYYIFYTALSGFPFSADNIRVGIATTKDFETFEKHPVTTFNAKAMALFPDKVDGKFAAVLTAHTDRPPAKIALALFEKESDIWSPEYWNEWYKRLDDHAIPILRSSADQVEAGAAPLKTEKGWVLIHSYIHNYRAGNPVFAIESVLLDAANPLKVLAQTHEPILVPEEKYERDGAVPNIAFPSGAVVHGGKVYVYYGAADEYCAVAKMPLEDLYCEMKDPKTDNPTCSCGSRRLERFAGNPILMPIPEHAWEAKAVFNPAALYLDGKVHIVYRAMSDDNTSTLGYAVSADGFHIDERLSYPIYEPRESFEEKRVPGGNSGCEDPRLTLIEDTVYMTYTAFNGTEPPRVALTTIAQQDFLARRWNWSKPMLISPPGVDDKDACVFPKEVRGKHVILHRINASVCADSVDELGELSASESRWLEGMVLFGPRPDRWDNIKIGIAAPPLKTREGWLLLYHGVSRPNNTYRVGAVLLNSENPFEIIARTNHPILEPELAYERKGQVPNVVFPCGMVVIEGVLYVYYGGADSVVGVATARLTDIIETIHDTSF